MLIDIKLDALDALGALLPAGDKETDERLEKDIDHLGRSLDSNLWEDESHLTDKGKKAFAEQFVSLLGVQRYEERRSLKLKQRCRRETG